MLGVQHGKLYLKTKSHNFLGNHERNQRTINQNRKSIGNLFIGILIGTLVGASAALLAAPQSGEKTRKIILEKGTELRDKASTTVQETRGKAGDVITKVRDRAGDFSKNINFNMRKNQASESLDVIAE